MNVTVEVTTAKTEVKTNKVVVIATIANFVEITAPVVVTYAVRVLSISGHSISAVAPDHILEGGTLAHAA